MGSRQLPPAPPAPASRCSSPRRAERAPKGPNRPPLGARTKSSAALSDLSVSQVFTVRENSDEPLQYLKLLGEVTTKKIAMKRSIEELDNASPEPVTEYPSSATRVELLKREMKLAQELQQEEGKLRGLQIQAPESAKAHAEFLRDDQMLEEEMRDAQARLAKEKQLLEEAEERASALQRAATAERRLVERNEHAVAEERRVLDAEVVEMQKQLRYTADELAACEQDVRTRRAEHRAQIEAKGQRRRARAAERSRRDQARAAQQTRMQRDAEAMADQEDGIRTQLSAMSDSTVLRSWDDWKQLWAGVSAKPRVRIVLGKENA